MTRRNDYATVCKVFADKGCVLLSLEYINSQTQLSFRCHCGRESTITLSNFKRRGRCYYCGKEAAAQKQSLTYEYVKKYFADRSCELLSLTYVNSKQVLEFKCSCGKSAQANFNKFQQGQIFCKDCSRQNKIAKFKHSDEKVAQELSSRGYTLMGPYVNARTPLKILCSQGHLTDSMTYDNITHDEKCPRCVGKGKLDLEYAKKYFADHGCILLATEYKNNETPMPYVCQCGRMSEMRFGNFQQGKRCNSCAIDKRSGKNSNLWNGNLTDQDRIRIRSTPEYRKWVKAVLQAGNHSCQCCGHMGEFLEAHHLNGYHSDEESRYEVSNGIVLCYWCHQVFHFVYGRKYNTAEQWRLFMSNINENMVWIQMIKEAVPEPLKFRNKNKNKITPAYLQTDLGLLDEIEGTEDV